METVTQLFNNSKEQMGKAIVHLKQAFAKIRAGKASPNMLSSIMVLYYGNDTPLSQVASVSTPDARTLSIKPWEKNTIPEIEKSIINSDLGLTPQNDGETIRITIPNLTEERRLELVKQAKNELENSKISIRNARKDFNNHLKQMQKNGELSEDEAKNAEINIQETTNEFSKKADEQLVIKEEEIMHV